MITRDNRIVKYDSTKVYFKANCDISKHTEITVDYDKFNWDGKRSFTNKS